jgi:hypothetical protein
MSRAARLLALGTLVQVVSLAPLAWRLLSGAMPPDAVWQLAAQVGLGGVALQAAALVALAWGARSWRRPSTRRSTRRPTPTLHHATTRSN